jgi:hypothetical protein
MPLYKLKDVNRQEECRDVTADRAVPQGGMQQRVTKVPTSEREKIYGLLC